MPASWWQERQPPAQKPNTGKWNRRCLSKAISSRINRVIYTIPSFYFRSLDFSEQGEGTVKGYHLHVQGKWTHEKAKRAKRELGFPEISISEMYFEIITSPLAEVGSDNDLLMTMSCSHPISRGFHSHPSHTCMDLNTEDPYSKMQLSPLPQDSWGPWGTLSVCEDTTMHINGPASLWHSHLGQAYLFLNMEVTWGDSEPGRWVKHPQEHEQHPSQTRCFREPFWVCTVYLTHPNSDAKGTLNLAHSKRKDIAFKPFLWWPQVKGFCFSLPKVLK